MPAGRPLEPVPAEIADSLVVWISQGKTLREFCRQPGMPTYKTIYDWLDKDARFGTLLRRARDIGEEVIAEECLDIADDDSNDVTSPVAINRAKLRIETRLKLLAIWNPKKYGQLRDPSSLGVAMSLLLSGALSERLTERLAPVLGDGKTIEGE